MSLRPSSARREPGFDPQADFDIVDVELRALHDAADPPELPIRPAAAVPPGPTDPVDATSAGNRQEPPLSLGLGEGVFGVRQLSLQLRTGGEPPRPVVEGLSFDLRRGELLGLVGESGAGKSLVGAALIDLLPPGVERLAGKLWFSGQRLDALPPAARAKLRGRRIAAIFQDAQAALDPLFTIGDQLVETVAHHHRLGRSAARQRAIALLGEVGLAPAEARLAQYPHELSGGQRQRVVIALALAGDPEVLIADEPTSALDVTLQAQVIDLLRRLARERGLGVLLITHDLALVAEVCQRVLVLYAGRMVEEGPVVEVLAHPLHPYTAGLLGTMPRLADRAGLPRPIPGHMPSPGHRPPGCAFRPRCPQADSACLQPPEAMIRGTRQRIAVRALGFDGAGEQVAGRVAAPNALPTQWAGQVSCWHPLDAAARPMAADRPPEGRA